MAYAIVETSGTQIRMEPGRFYDVNRLSAEEGDTITLDRVLFVENEGEFMVGQPLVEGAVVEATVQGNLRGRKIIVYKMRPKKKTRKKQGHRQDLTRIMINAIKVNGSVVAGEAEPSAKSAKASKSTSSESAASEEAEADADS